MPIDIGVQLYSVRDQLAADRAVTLERIAALGFTSVEPYNPADDPQGFRRLADDLGLRVSSSHASSLLTDPDAAFEAVAILGTRHAILAGGIPEHEFTTLDGLARTADLLVGLSEQAAKHGVQVGYHNHWWEIEPRFDGRPALAVLAELLPPEVFLEVDTYWAAVGGADVPALLAELGGRVGFLHVKDGPVKHGEAHTAVGSGAMDVPPILAASPDAVRIVELDDCDTDLFEALGASHAYLSGLGHS